MKKINFSVFFSVFFTLTVLSCSSGGSSGSSSNQRSDASSNKKNDASKDSSSGASKDASSDSSSNASKDNSVYVEDLVVNAQGKLQKLNLFGVSIFSSPQDDASATLNHASNTMLDLLAKQTTITLQNATPNALFGSYSVAANTSFAIYFSNQGTKLTLITSLQGKDTTYTVFVPTYDAINNPYGVYGVEDLVKIGDKKGSYLQKKDIILPNLNDASAPAALGKNYPVQGYPTSNFRDSTYDGDNHSIKNLVVKDAYGGLLGEINNSVVKNLKIVDASISGSNGTGVLASTVVDSTLSHLEVSGKVSIQNSITGGLVGESSRSKIADCSSSVEVFSTGSAVGGLVGQTNAGSIANSKATGKVSGVSQVGGLVGQNGMNSTLPAPFRPKIGSINNSKAEGTVTGTGESIGGLIGLDLGGEITDSSSSGNVTGPKAKSGTVNKFIGWQVPETKIVNSGGTGQLILQ